MNEYILYATGSAQPVQNATLTFLVTADAKPLVYWFIAGVITGILVWVFVIVINNLIWALYDRLLENTASKKQLREQIKKEWVEKYGPEVEEFFISAENSNKTR